MTKDIGNRKKINRFPDKNTRSFHLAAINFFAKNGFY